LEEFINNPESEFVKFVHNGDAVPLLADNDPLDALAEILCFTQHVQYVKSGGLIFISNYQGVFSSLPFICSSSTLHRHGTSAYGPLTYVL